MLTRLLLLLACSTIALGFQGTTNNRARFVLPHKTVRTTTRLFQSADNNNGFDPVRLNKVFKASHSRRQADRLIQDGRVSVNGEETFGCMVVPFKDVVELDGKVVKGWEQMNGLVMPKKGGKKLSKATSTTASAAGVEYLEYVKYWKPRGVICTTDQSIRDNIIDEITLRSGYTPKHRVYPVGRLDKDTSGLILLTSDGRLPNNSLRQSQKQPKVYQVEVEETLTDADLDHLRNGIVITTIAQSDGRSKPLTARTKACHVYQVSPTCFEITLMEGRNRQIRKMLDALGHRVAELHRIRFGMISMDELEYEGDWKRLDGPEMEWIETLLQDTPEEDVSN